MEVERRRVRLIALCSLALIAALAVNPATAYAKTRTKVSVSASTKTPAYNARVTIRAKLRTSSGRVLANKTVSIQRWTGSAWTTIKRGTTSSRGTVSLATLPKGRVTTVYRARFGGNSKYSASASSQVTVKPKVYLPKPNGPDTWRVSEPFTIHGPLKPVHPAESAAVTVYRYHGTSQDGPWVQDAVVGGIAKLNADGTGFWEASVVVPDSSFKYWRFRVFHAADDLNAATWSPEMVWGIRD